MVCSVKAIKQMVPRLLERPLFEGPESVLFLLVFFGSESGVLEAPSVSGCESFSHCCFVSQL